MIDPHRATMTQLLSLSSDKPALLQALEARAGTHGIRHGTPEQRSSG